MATTERWLPDFSADQRILLAWPYRNDVWREKAEPARKALLKLIAQLPDNTLFSLVVPANLGSDFPRTLKPVHCIEIDYDDIWLRDIGPLWRHTESGLEALSFDFDGWGGIQQAIAADKCFARKLCTQLKRPLHQSNLIAEGGAFTHNGNGCWLVGLTCLKRRNRELTGNEIKSALGQLLPEQCLYFFEGSLSADETGGHIDNMALFVDSDTLLYATTDNETHPDYETCQLLKNKVRELPESIKKIPLPLPLPQLATKDERLGIELTRLSLERTVDLPLLCSYVNVLQTNELVVVPQFGLATDHNALQAICRALPERQVIAFDAREFVLGGGGLHCISHNLPSSAIE
ncbi:agmatine deiminase family protein [Idiomarina ramblicola]|uniref:Agmatine deiminase family protein n=1 Tax=Idiomarina ramblicola TaxID=263724 RepID=A0A432Z658_9GAMM|nr:agmatine deiminase family protein [Idiomarina ramblicola]RUO73382.1 agmatine deiminase family protein [Idiomarina ramblicola]